MIFLKFARQQLRHLICFMMDLVQNPQSKKSFHLCLQLEDPRQADDALDGLRQIVAVRSTSVLPFLIPKLISNPITVSQAKALASLADVAGRALYYQLSNLIPALIGGMAREGDAGVEIKKHAEAVLAQVNQEGIHLLFQEFFKLIKDNNANTRKGVVELIGAFLSSTNSEFDPSPILDGLIPLLNDSKPPVQVAAHAALTNLSKILKKEALPPLIPSIRSAIASVMEELRKERKEVLPGFSLPQGIGPLLPFFLQGLMFGSPEIRAQSADGIGDLIKLTSEASLKPHVVQITGPLIRIIGDRFPWQVKAAILNTLSLLLDKAGAHIKPFLPPLQTTFIKALNDPIKEVRLHAAGALGKLMALAPRIDPLLNELLTGLNNTEKGVKEAVLQALQMVLDKVTTKIDAKVSANLIQSLTAITETEDDALRSRAAKVLAAYACTLDADELDAFLKKVVLRPPGSGSWKEQLFILICLGHIISSPRAKMSKSLFSSSVAALFPFFTSDKPPVRDAVCGVVSQIFVFNEDSAAGKERKEEMTSSASPLITSLSSLFSDPTNDVRIAALNAVKSIAKRRPEVIGAHLQRLIPPLIERLKERASMTVKLAAERTLLHVLQLQVSDARLEEYTRTADPASAKYLSDYCKRVISKLEPTSDDEAEADADAESS
eukprot:TRINITY_DN1461_c0_g6_i1.p1 TRINITY_DN1461_c0_g6~~TRINITY_DN1461_c0_g6_i1.p1  ORF type:complete len:664 (-),score=207.03 TRINITY_DN1461_c0_g6_i1:124-2115(-)